jgi:hypothetical protein
MAFAHPFYYPAPRRDSTRPANLANPRDCEANSELRLALHGLGYDFGESVLNYPADPCRFDLLPDELLTRVEFPFAAAGDVLVKTTRPPLSDEAQGDSKKIEPSNTTVERAIFRQYWRYFYICARSRIKLTDAAARFLPADKQDRAEMLFYQKSANYMYLQGFDGVRLGGREPLGDRTAAFVLRVDEIWPGGPGLCAAWSLNALATLAFCGLVRTRCPEVLENRGLTMFELDSLEPPKRPTSYAWMREWKMTEIFWTQGELP